MKKSITIGLSTMLALVPVLSSAADRVGDFTLLDQEGYSHQMSWYDDHAAIAFLIQANGTAVSTSTRREF
ncbi:MAG: hypothetical protein QGF90_20090, partial [Gammaproteobacteria bacterium]|nr:hypothetical protein [Gammaproteobacteria bacterium]